MTFLIPENKMTSSSLTKILLFIYKIKSDEQLYYMKGSTSSTSVSLSIQGVSTSRGHLSLLPLTLSRT